MFRNIVKIDPNKCNGCGLCVTACAEGAIQIVDGKARLVKDQYCDGLGACLGECPQGAITIEQRDAEAFDEEAVKVHLAGQTKQAGGSNLPSSHAVFAGGAGRAAHGSAPAAQGPAGGCPGAAAMSLGTGCPGSAPRTMSSRSPEADFGRPAAPQTPSALRNWPVQLKLISPMAPYLNGARLCIAADCTAYACADFHAKILAGKVLLIGCPKLDDVALYQEKLTAVFRHNNIQSVDVVYMEVPCCFGLVHVVRQAVKQSGTQIPLELVKIAVEGGTVQEARPDKPLDGAREMRQAMTPAQET
jgi:Pyruvate/2-oxoacid:ferredoxin oxidoreductase delta subunit